MTRKPDHADRRQPGYYPGFHTLDQAAFWDEATRNLVLARVRTTPEFRFFSTPEATLLRAVCNRMLPQDDRGADHKIPVAEMIDERLHAGRIEGYRFADMPPDGEAHRLGLRAITEIAVRLFGRGFEALAPLQQDSVLLTIHDARPPAGAAIWQRMPVDRYWLLLLHDVISAYYAHPYAWDEIGFGGPAYPRGYMRLNGGEPEPWEVPERRYDFAAPADSLSGAFTPLGKSNHGVKP